MLKTQKKHSPKDHMSMMLTTVHCHAHQNRCMLMNLFYMVIMYYAIYLSFKRNKGFRPGPFLAALFFSPFYILYAWAVPIAEHYTNTGSITADVILNLLGLVCFFYAIFLSFQRNNGFSLGPFLAAFFFSPLYILYAIADHLSQGAQFTSNMKKGKGKGSRGSKGSKGSSGSRGSKMKYM